MGTINSSNKGSSSKTRHVWTTEEDNKLVQALLTLYHSKRKNHKVDNGFKSCHALAIEKILEEELPGHEIKADPHIESRLRTVKKHYHAIKEMDSSSGFSWDYDRHCVICEKDVFDGWVMSHKDAKGLRNKPFPHYDSLSIIFGKDRASGKRAEGIKEVVKELNEEENSVFLEEKKNETQTDDFSSTRKVSSEENNTGQRKRKNKK